MKFKNIYKYFVNIPFTFYIITLFSYYKYYIKSLFYYYTMNNTIFIDTSYNTTDLCTLGGIYNTDKSPLSYNSVCSKFRKGYTGVYSILFSTFKTQNINIAEIGIADGASTILWEKWFVNANIYAFDNCTKFIEKCKQKTNNVKYNYCNVKDENILHKSFKNINVLFDIIIDDSDHILSSQNNIINVCHNHLKPNGILIIEDIHISTSITKYNINTQLWSYYTFIICHNSNQYHRNDHKILYLVKK